ncbi:Transmembrane protein, partial [Globisporangium splendens]
MLEAPHATSGDDYDASNNRFVAGNKFFNYQQFGALRDGGGVKLFSRDYCGILFATAGSSFIYAILRYCMRPTLMNFLELHIKESSAVTECLLSIPTCLSLFMGLISDIYPIGGYRRKSYMIVGMMLSFCSNMGLAILTATIDPHNASVDTRTSYIAYYMALIMGATFGTMFSKIATDSRVIELSQREPLTTRGALQIDYLIFRSTIECIASWVTALLVTYDKTQGQYTFHQFEPFYGYAALAFVSLIPVPFVLRNCTEATVFQAEADAMSTMASQGVFGSPKISAMDRVRAFVRMCQQRAVWQIVLFLTIVLAATRFYFTNANRSLKKLAALDAEASLRSDALKYFAVIGIMVWWKVSWSNSSWRRCMFLAVFALVFLETVRALLMIYVPSIRGQVLYDVMGCFTGLFDGLINIFSFIPATEIAENGAEGATIGLFLAFRSILAVSMRTISENIMTTKVTSDDEGKLTLLLMITYAVHALAFLGVLLLPRQKLDAQQLRVYGGYSKMACGVLIVIFLLSFSYAMTQNLSAMISMANGKGT